MAEFGSSDGPTRSRVTFLTLAQQWEVDVLPTKYKHSTQKNHQHIMEKHLIPRFGELALCRRHDSSHPNVCDASDQGGICAEVDRSHP